MKYYCILVLFVTNSMCPQSSFELASNYYNLQKYEQAKTLFGKFLLEHPNDVKSLEYLGDIQCQLHHWEGAIPYYQKLKRFQPYNAEYHYKYGGAMAMVAKESNVFKALSMIKTIEDPFKMALTLNPRHIGARWALIEIYLQLPRVIGGSEEKAIKYSAELAVISIVDGYLSRGHIEEYFKRYAKAEKQYLKAIEVGKSAATYQKLADLYKNKMAQPEKARQLLAVFNEKNKS